ncbi:MAG: hypothetical protein HY775_09760 [Acidobacteria bacterium]|nr:hypothetical protein [Acidobacteriota bacterium]
MSGIRKLGAGVAAGALLAALGVAGGAQATTGIVAGAAKESITPFTVVPGVTTAVDPYSNLAASNPDGMPAVGLWDTFEPEPGARSAGQVTATGLWGEPFTDSNGNGRYDSGEPFVDDPANTRLDPTSANKWDGLYMAGYGNDRIPLGVWDKTWARALYLRDPASGLGFAHVSIDALGWFSDWNDRVVALARRINPAMDLDYMIVSHTHDHESPDTHIGIWGPDQAVDGTYPKYERYIEYKIAQAVAEAAAAAEPAKFRFAEIGPGTSFTTLRNNVEDLEGLQSRNECRTPWVFDDEVRVMQVAADDDGQTIAAVVNWGTHVEAMDGDNLYLSSDYASALRETVEEGLGGGVALQTQGAQAAGEVIGDSCGRRWQRHTFDGETFPVDSGGNPLATQPPLIRTEPEHARDRAYAIGRVAGSAAVRAAEAALWDVTATAIEGFTARDLYVPVNNEALAALAAVGVIDKPTYVGGASAGAVAGGAAGMDVGAPTGVDAKTTIYAWKIGSASFVTAPGELFPEAYFGLEAHNRTVAGTQANHFDYTALDGSSANTAALACSSAPFSYEDPKGADTGRPYEPGIREAQVKKFATDHNFLLGYTPDLLGYIVPGYDFAWYALPPADGAGIGALVGEVPDPCASFPPDSLVPGAIYNEHYQETNSAGSMLAPAYACTVWRMLGLDPATSAEGAAACDDWDAWRTAGLIHVGVDPALCDPSGELGDLNDCVRHH